MYRSPLRYKEVVDAGFVMVSGKYEPPRGGNRGTKRRHYICSVEASNIWVCDGCYRGEACKLTCCRPVILLLTYKDLLSLLKWHGVLVKAISLIYRLSIRI